MRLEESKQPRSRARFDVVGMNVLVIAGLFPPDMGGGSITKAVDGVFSVYLRTFVALIC